MMRPQNLVFLLCFTLIAAASPASIPSSSPVFVEFIYEIAAQPFENAFQAETPQPEFLNGYLLDETTSPAVLYPATGQEKQLSGNILVGYHLQNSLTSHGIPFQSIHGFQAQKSFFHTTETNGPALLLEKLGPWTPLVREVRVEMEAYGGNILHLSAEGKIFDLTQGSSATLWNGEQEYTLPGFLEAYLQLRKARAAAAMSPAALEEIRTDLKFFFPDGKPARFYLRLSAHFHGPVTVSAFDALTEWNKSSQNLDAGLYAEALTNLEHVLLAAPGHQEALARWGEINQLVKSGKTPASLTGRLVFPEGFPTAAQKELWKKYHEGYVTLRRPESNPDTSLASEPVKNGAFKIAAPGGAYQLRILVPGFQPFEKNVTLKDQSEMEVLLQSASGA